MAGRRTRVVAVTGLALIALPLTLWQVSKARCFALIGPTVCHVETRRPQVALTFDDGPTAYGVDAILPVLRRHGVHSTFFLIGRDMAAHPELVRRIRAEGHEIGNHSFSHRRMVARPAAFYETEIARTEALITASGPSSGLFRPPYGKKLIGLPLALRRQGLTMIMWDVEDSTEPDPRKFADRILAATGPGSIILIHGMTPARHTEVEALPLILEGLKARGLEVVTVGRLRADAE